MAQQVIDVGTSASDGTGDPLRDAFTKINDNFTELYGTVENEGLTYGNISSNVAGITFNVTRYAESYSAIPVLKGTGQSVGNIYVIRGNVLGGSTPVNDVYLTVTTLSNAIVGNIATVSTIGVPVSPVLRVNGLTGNITLTVNNIDGVASRAYVNAAITSNIANVTGSITDSLRANITAANSVISNHSSRITTLESNSSAQALQINNLVSVKANVSYVDTSINLALSSNAILANVAAVNANVAAANSAILLRANLSGAVFTGNISANFVHANNTVRADTYFIGGTEANQALGQTWSNPAALFFGNSSGSANSYYQINLQNLDSQGSGDIVVTADDGSDGSNFITFGINNSQYSDPQYPIGFPHDGYVFVTGGNLGLQSQNHDIQLVAGNLNVPQIILTTSNVIQLGQNVIIAFSDGTVQSTAFGGNANITAINANVTAANAAITSLQSNAAAQALSIDALYANAGIQAASLSTLTANAATQATSINDLTSNVSTLISNAAVQSGAITSLQSNIFAANLVIAGLTSNAATQSQELDNLQSNAQSQQSAIVILQSNSATQAVQLDLLNSNLTAANAIISTFSSNAATQSVQISLINANISAANVNVATLFSNAAAQSLDLQNLHTNVNFYLSNVASSNANIAAANARIIVLDANLGSTSTNVSTLQSNAAVQAVAIGLLNANVEAANIAKANLSGAIFSGNVQANYVLANANVKIASTLEVGQPNPINYPGLGGVFVGNVDSYYQIVVHNLNSGADASGDIVITADDGSDENNYINIGINSSGWSGNYVVPAGDTGLQEFPHDGYFNVIGGNATIRTDANVFFVANTSVAGLLKDGDFIILANLFVRDNITSSTINSNAVSIQGNITAGNISATGQIDYTMGNSQHWTTSVSNVAAALDQIAARLYALEHP